MSLREWQKKASEFFIKNPNSIYTVSTGCVDGDTYIDLPRDNIKYPEGIKIKDLINKKNFYIYTFNINKNKIELKKCKRVWCSGIKDVYKIKTNNKTIIVTDNHPFLYNVYDKPNWRVGIKGEKPKIIGRYYKQVKDLKIGDKITTFNRPRNSWSKDGVYVRVNYGRNYKRVLEHRFIMQELGYKMDNFTSTHHIDRNRYNNSIENLKAMSIREHTSMHHRNDNIKSGKDLWKSGEHPKGMKGKKHSEISKTYISKNVSSAKINKSYVTYRTKSNFNEIGYEIQKQKKPHNSQKIKDGLSKIPREKFKERCRLNNQIKYSEKITSIEYVGKKKVYDMEVEDNHNFIANGFIVHNSGKSYFAIHCIKLVLNIEPNIKTLIVAPKNVILEQTWLDELHNLGFPINRVGLFNQSAKEFSQITLCSIQSLQKVIDMGLYDYFNFVIFDELHNYGTKGSLSILQKPKKYKIGLTATLEREDLNHFKIKTIFNHKIYNYSIEESIRDKILNKFDFYCIKLSLNEEEQELYEELTKTIYSIIKTAKTPNIQFIKDDILRNRYLKAINQRKELVDKNKQKRNAVVDIVKKHASNKIIVFNQYNSVSKELYWDLLDNNLKSDIVNSDINKYNQTKAFNDFEEDRNNVLLTTTMTDEGYNLPKIDIAILMAQNSTNKQFIQRMGRVLRKKEHNSIVFYILIKDTYEEKIYNKRKKFIQKICDNFKETDY